MGMGLEANFLDPVEFCPWMAQELPGTDRLRAQGLRQEAGLIPVPHFADEQRRPDGLRRPGLPATFTGAAAPVSPCPLEPGASAVASTLSPSRSPEVWHPGPGLSLELVTLQRPPVQPSFPSTCQVAGDGLGLGPGL